MVGTSGQVFTITSRKARTASLPLPFFVPPFLGAALATGALLAMAFFGVDFLVDFATVDCPSSKQMGLLSVFHKGGSGSSLFDVKPLGVDGSSGGFGWSVF